MPTKLGPHSFNAHRAVSEYVTAGSPLVKLVDDFGIAAELLALNSNLLLIGRLSQADQPVVAAWMDKPAYQAAYEFVEHQRENYRLNPLIQIWEGPHEPDLGQAADAES